MASKRPLNRQMASQNGKWRPTPSQNRQMASAPSRNWQMASTNGKWRPQMANGARNLLKMASTTPLIFCGAASASGARAARGNLQTLQCESTLRPVSPSLALWARCRGAAERAAEHGGDGARAIVHRRDLPFLRERRTRYAIFERRCGRHLQFMEVVDAICLLWTQFAICGRHLPILRGCGRHLPMEGEWTPYAIYGGRGRHLPFSDAICLFRGRLDAICHFPLYVYKRLACGCGCGLLRPRRPAPRVLHHVAHNEKRQTFDLYFKAWLPESGTCVICTAPTESSMTCDDVTTATRVRRYGAPLLTARVLPRCSLNRPSHGPAADHHP